MITPYFRLVKTFPERTWSIDLTSW